MAAMAARALQPPSALVIQQDLGSHDRKILQLRAES